MPRARYAIATLFVVAAGLTLRRVPLGLPATVVKYGGSLLWATMLYGVLATLGPASTPRRLALSAYAVASAVECFKLVHTPASDAFRRTLAGTLLLGRFFSVQDLAAYAVAILVTAAINHRTRGAA